jgi:hypothetical protein
VPGLLDDVSHVVDLGATSAPLAHALVRRAHRAEVVGRFAYGLVRLPTVASHTHVASPGCSLR